MANKDTSLPKVTKAAANKSVKKPVESLTRDEQLVAKRADLIEARRGLAAGELTNPRMVSSLRKDIARLLTAQNQDLINDTKDSKVSTDTSKENN